MSKRRLQDDDDEPMLSIRLADEAGEPLQAQQLFVRTFSKLCRRLPSDSDVWDLSNLLIDGQPVPRETVIAWLNKAYAAANGRGTSFQQQESDMCQSFTGLYQLLAFADAVDSTQAMMDVCVAQLDGLQLHAQLGEQRLQLETDGRQYFFIGREQNVQLMEGFLTEASPVDTPAADEAEVAAFRAQVAAQTEQLLFMAIKLQLAPLFERLRSFIATSYLANDGVLETIQEVVLSERVLDAAVGANRLGRQAWVDSILQQRCALVSDTGTTPGWCQLLRPLDDEDKEPLNFRAELTRDFMGTARGTVVDVELDLLGEGMVTINPRSVDKIKLLAQLLLSESVQCAP